MQQYISWLDGPSDTRDAEGSNPSCCTKVTNKDRSIREHKVCVNNPRNIVEEPFDSDSVVVHDLLVPFNIIYVPVAQSVAALDF